MEKFHSATHGKSGYRSLLNYTWQQYFPFPLRMLHLSLRFHNREPEQNLKPAPGAYLQAASLYT